MKITDKVVTSKGRFGTIEDISIDGTKAMVKMGHKVHEILISELNLLSNTIPFNVFYIDKFDANQTIKTEIVQVPKNTVIYDITSHNDAIINTVKLLLLKRLNNHDLLIQKIQLL